MLQRNILLALAAMIAGLGVYLEFVRDIRTPTSTQVAREAILTSSGSGQAAQRIKMVYGLTKIEGTSDIFPFAFGPDVEPWKVEGPYSAHMKIMMERRFPPGSLNFNNQDFAVGPCRNASPAELGLRIAGPLLGLGSSKLCTVESRRNATRRMLVGIVVANNGLWSRPFSRSICRSLSHAWLAKAENQFDYVRCIVADRPDYWPWGTATFEETYAVNKSHGLAHVAALAAPAGSEEEFKLGASADEVRRDITALRQATYEAAFRLKNLPCDYGAKKDYIAAMTVYVRKWRTLMPCYLNAPACTPAAAQFQKKNMDTFGPIGDPALVNTLNDLSGTGAIAEGDFAEDVVGLAAQLSNDPMLVPSSIPQVREAQLAGRRTPSCARRNVR